MISCIYLIYNQPEIRIYFRKILNSKLKAFVLIAITLVILIATAIFLYQIKKDSADGRTFIWKSSLEIIKDKPIFGSGFDSYINSFNNYKLHYFQKNVNDQKNAFLTNERFIVVF